MKKKYDRSKFIKTLEEAPFVSYAAKKSGISRATIYRWRKSNPEFREQLEKSLDSGRGHLIDVAEMALVEKIKAKDMGAIKFFLQHNDIRYRPVRTAFIPPSTAPERPVPGKPCKTCGELNYADLPEEELKRRIRELEETARLLEKNDSHDEN